MQKYEYDETKPNALSIMDGNISQYKNHLDEDFIFKMSDDEAVTFTWKGDGKGHSIQIKKGKSTSTVIFSYVGENSTKIPGGVSIKTPTGRFRPQGLDLHKAFKAKNVTSLNGLTIRQMHEIAKEALEEYNELLRMMHES